MFNYNNKLAETCLINNLNTNKTGFSPLFYHSEINIAAKLSRDKNDNWCDASTPSGHKAGLRNLIIIQHGS